MNKLTWLRKPPKVLKQLALAGLRPSQWWRGQRPATAFQELTGLLALLLLAWALRLFRLEAQSIWWDEGISLHLATSSLGEIVRDRLNNVHPPLYFILLKGWVWLVGPSAFGGRYLSALASLMQVALMFTVCRNVARVAYPLRTFRFGKPGYRAAWVAAVLVAISPLSVIYGQEIRVYALLPLVYLAMLLAAARYFRSRRAAVLVALACVEWIALHLHYISVFAVAYTAVWGLWRSRGAGEQGGRGAVSSWQSAVGSRWSAISNPRSAMEWLVAHGLVALASLPWFVAVFLNRSAVQSEANAGTFATEPVPLDYLLPQVWTFHLAGLANALARPHIGWIAGVAAVAMVVAILVARVAYPRATPRFGKSGYKAELLLQWLLPLSSALLVWSVRSFSHPRYVIIFAIALFPLLAVLIAPLFDRPRSWSVLATRVPALLLGLSVVYLSFWGLGQYFFNPNVEKPDIRGVARFLQTAVQPADVIIIPETDWSLPFEYQGTAKITMAPTADCRLPTANCLPWLFTSAEPRHAFAVDYPQGTRDWQGRTPFELERQGVLVATHSFDDVLVREYQLNAGGNPTPDCQGGLGIHSIEKRFGPLLLHSAWIEQGAAADTAVTLVLCWEVVQPAAGRYGVALRLLDEDGWTINQADSRLVDSNGRPIDQWPVGAAVTTYHVLPLTPGTPPLHYSLAIGAYLSVDGDVEALDVVDEQGAPQGQQVSLGDVQLSPAQFSQAGEETAVHNPYNLPEPPRLVEPVTIADGLRLVAVGFASGPYLPGQSVPLYLTWQATRPSLPMLEPELALEQNGEVESTTRGRLLTEQYPTTNWQAGEIVTERRLVEVPVSADPGAATLMLRLGDRSAVLGEVEIAAAERLEALPAEAQPVEATFGDLARLAGYRLPETTATAGDDVVVTLYWQALETGGDDYTVFAHILDADGRLIGQHDSVPVDGQRPISSWVVGEFIADTHVMVSRDAAYTGPATIEVGLYDPQTGRRLTLPDGSDAFQLSVALLVKRQ